MRKPQPKTLPVTEIPLSHHEVTIRVFFLRAKGTHFSLHAVPEPGSGAGGGPILVECHSEEGVHVQLLDETQVRPSAQLAYLVHELGGPDHEPQGRVIIQLAGHRGGLKNGCITIEIPRGQVALRYFELVEGDGYEDGDSENGDDEEEG
jgi:hypothetical protein